MPLLNTATPSFHNQPTYELQKEELPMHQSRELPIASRNHATTYPQLT